MLGEQSRVQSCSVVWLRGVLANVKTTQPPDLVSWDVHALLQDATNKLVFKKRLYRAEDTHIDDYQFTNLSFIQVRPDARRGVALCELKAAAWQLPGLRS